MVLNEMEVVILGRVASKKNSKQAFFNKRLGRIMVLPSKSYGRFKEDALSQLRQWGATVPGPYKMEYVFEMRGLGATDGDNMEASINDILQEAGIIDDDKNILSTMWVKVLGAKDYRTTVKISTVN